MNSDLHATIHTYPLDQRNRLIPEPGIGDHHDLPGFQLGATPRQERFPKSILAQPRLDHVL
jgi:hypothetical protein